VCALCVCFVRFVCALCFLCSLCALCVCVKEGGVRSPYLRTAFRNSARYSTFKHADSLPYVYVMD
jgi:hypothetical protein